VKTGQRTTDAILAVATARLSAILRLGAPQRNRVAVAGEMWVPSHRHLRLLRAHLVVACVVLELEQLEALK